MKKIILAFSILFSVQMSQAQQCDVVGGDFETWMTQDIGTFFGDTVAYEMAPAWMSLSDMFGIIFGGSAYTPTITKSTDKNGGTYAAKMTAADTSGTELMNIGACVERPKKLTGYYKYDGKAGDSLMCVVGLTKGEPQDFMSSGDPNDAIGYGDALLTTTSTYTKFTINIAYSTAQIPDSFLIMFALLNSNTSGAISAYVDDVQFEELSSVDEQIYNTATFSTYPNPSSEGAFNLNIENLKSDFVQVQVFSMTGQRLVEKNTDTAGDKSYQQRIDLGTYSKGLYIVRVYTQNGFYSEKLRVE